MVVPSVVDDTDVRTTPTDLQTVVDAWDCLPTAVRDLIIDAISQARK